MNGPVKRTRAALDDLKGSASTGIVLGIAALFVAVVALIVGLRK